MLETIPPAAEADARPGRSSQRQELKFTLHRKLLDKINLEALAPSTTAGAHGSPPGGDP